MLLSYLIPSVFYNYFTEINLIHHYNTRSKADLYVSTVNSNFGQKASIYSGSKLWNALPIDLKKYSSVQYFKNNIASYLADKS